MSTHEVPLPNWDPLLFGDLVEGSADVWEDAAPNLGYSFHANKHSSRATTTSAEILAQIRYYTEMLKPPLVRVSAFMKPDCMLISTVPGERRIILTHPNNVDKVRAAGYEIEGES